MYYSTILLCMPARLELCQIGRCSPVPVLHGSVTDTGCNVLLWAILTLPFSYKPAARNLSPMTSQVGSKLISIRMPPQRHSHQPHSHLFHSSHRGEFACDRVVGRCCTNVPVVMAHSKPTQKPQPQTIPPISPRRHRCRDT